MAAFVLNANGKRIIANKLSGTGADAATVPAFLAWGTGGVAATAADTALGTIAAPTVTTAVTGTASTVTITNTGDTFQVVGTITAGGVLNIIEVALLNQATVAGASNFLRADHGSTVLVSGDSIAYTIRAQFT